ncbi:MAG: cell division protein ZapA [Chitinophagaceae bacterium]|jgi:cell division protein ZapA|nr:cell division protein ZapA [Chitinophagaceae bacterium]MBP6590888.1 cell division protein ZapA [Chitinophagaceae bacterium]
MSELIPISALVGDRTFRVKIETADEEVVRKTLKTINDKVVEFKTLFAGKDMQDYISMVLLWFATEQHAGRSANVELDNVTDQLNTIEKMLDGQLTETTPAG